MASLLLFMVLCSCCSMAHGGDERSYAVVPTSTFEPEAVCSTAGVKLEQSHTVVSVPLVHRHGPCAPLQSADNKPFSAQTLCRRRAGVNYIMSRAPRGMTRTRDDETVSLPTHLGSSVDSLEYIFTVSFGTPAVPQVVLVDTGSDDLSWVQCTPCNSGECSPQEDPLFDPSHSSTYRPVPCDSDACRNLTADEYRNGCTSDGHCRFAIAYADGMSTTGVYGAETLKLAPGATVKNFRFGCGHDKRRMGKHDGVLGLGRLQESLAAQASPVYGGAYCLPAANSQPGFLALRAPRNSGFVFTPMGRPQQETTFYVVTLAGVTVGDKQLDVPPWVFSGGMIIDSGAIVTGLPSTAYLALQSAFRQAMAAYPLLPNGRLDTCYNLTGYNNVTVPRVALTFSGGATIDLDVPNGVLLDGCLAFKLSGPDSMAGVIGNVNQRTLEVLFDNSRGRVGFRANAC